MIVESIADQRRAIAGRGSGSRDADHEDHK
jgi:hypothetical protein